MLIRCSSALGKPGILGWTGIILSVIYLFCIYHLALSGGRVEELYQLKLNSLGDFLAGAFGPLAIFGLVLGFFQQRQELKQNTSALLLQKDQLEKSVEQQRDMVQVSREQILNQLQRQQDESMRVARAGNPDIRIVRTELAKIDSDKDVIRVVAVNIGGDSLLSDIDVSNRNLAHLLTVKTTNNEPVQLWQRSQSLYFDYPASSILCEFAFWATPTHGIEPLYYSIHIDCDDDGDFRAVICD